MCFCRTWATKIFLPNEYANEYANEGDYRDGFKLFPAEWELLRPLTESSRQFLLKQADSSALVDFNLTGMDTEMAILSGTELFDGTHLAGAARQYQKRSDFVYSYMALAKVSANKNSIKIIGERIRLHVQGYFGNDSRKAGAVIVSHLRFGPRPIRSSYLLGDGDAWFVPCHQARFLERYDLLDQAASGGVFLLNSPTPPERVWDILPRRTQQQIIDNRLGFHVIDAYAIAAELNLGRQPALKPL